LKYRGEPTETEIGDDNTIRESVTISRGTVGGGGVTRLGSNCLLMTCVHIGHDSQVGSHCILANAATLAGHVIIEDYVTWAHSARSISTASVGKYAFIGGGTIVTQDVLPFLAHLFASAKTRPSASTKSASSGAASRRSGCNCCKRPSACCWRPS
jgi:UDP-N-acetylglucosamine acyltransferase